MSCIVLSIISLTVSSCGNIFTAQVAEDTLSFGVSSLMATPRQWVYYPSLDRSCSFKPADDLTVVAFYADGTTRNVPVEMVSIVFQETPVADIDRAISLVEGENPFKVSYGDKVTEFVLMVGSNTGTSDDPETGGGQNGGTTIEISPPVWL
jgi:hypothetical protein